MTPDPAPPDQTVPPVLEVVVADPPAAHAAGGHGPVHTHCANCGTPLQGPFCHRCGQHDFDFNRSFGHVFQEALENFFHFDAKLFRNIITLLFRPGVLSVEFNAGHRVAQMPPLRLYIFVSILFFFVEFANPQTREDVVRIDPKDPAALQEAVKKPRAIVRQNLAPATGGELPAKADPAAEAGDAQPADPRSELETTLEKKGRFVYEHQHEVAEAFIHAIPKMLLFCLPCFALFTRVLFRKSGQAYLPHLVVALHFHTFVFLWLLVRDGWGALAGLASPGVQGLLLFAAGVWLTAYPVVMLRRLFGNSWKLTLFKTGVLTFAYSLTLALVFAAAALVIFAML